MCFLSGMTHVKLLLFSSVRGPVRLIATMESLQNSMLKEKSVTAACRTVFLRDLQNISSKAKVTSTKRKQQFNISDKAVRDA